MNQLYEAVFILLYILSLGLINQVAGNKIVIQNLNEEYGLAKNRVNCMFQDSKGFLWFGMVNGLYKFDQYSFGYCSSRKNKDNGFPEANIRAIIEIEPGLLLLIEAGKNIQTIMRDHRGDLWLGSEGEGVIRFHPDKNSGYLKGTTINYRLYLKSFPTNTLQLYRKAAALTNQTVYNYIRTIRLNKAAQLLLTTDMQIAEIALSVDM
jgi:ligand-binding sensor domain-containing protein